ncbi:MAG TPA: MFS transporter [Candidatus Dormibacteraeota bacterium]|nr:MFS transporter [Candidatus Dormibacteraeota bacterium]
MLSAAGSARARDRRGACDSGPGPETAPRWRRNLAALWFAEFTAIFGFSFAFPFLPVYLGQLGVQDPRQLAFWSGLAGGASGFTMAAMSPIWGWLADRRGRKPMLVRAMIGGAVTVGLIGFARGPMDVVALRLVQGATSGTIAAATALVAAGTPRARVAWALGLLTSSVAVGNALGPSLGGLAASLFGLRPIFWAGGALLLVATIPVVVVVREAPLTRAEESGVALARSHAGASGAAAAVAALIACQGLLQIANSGYQPLVTLRLLQQLPSGVELVAGVAFAAAGLASASSSALCSRFTGRFGYRRVALGGAILLVGAELLGAQGPGPGAVVAGAALAGAFYGGVGPALSSMIGLETPRDVQARVFGLASSATSIGFALGPLGGGLLASRLGTAAAMSLCAGVALLLSLVLAFGAREPSP